jgi:hypothetical protein
VPFAVACSSTLARLDTRSSAMVEGEIDGNGVMILCMAWIDEDDEEVELDFTDT